MMLTEIYNWPKKVGNAVGLYLESVSLGGDATRLNHGDEDGDVTQRAALPPSYTHPEGVGDALRGESDLKLT